MGQHQLLVIVLSMVLIGAAIVAGLTMVQVNAMEISRAALVHDLLHFASKARGYYWRPSYLGGASRDFTNVMSMNLFVWDKNANGTYAVESASKDEIILVGVASLVVGGDSVRVRMRVNEKTSKVEYLN